MSSTRPIGASCQDTYEAGHVCLPREQLAAIIELAESVRVELVRYMRGPQADSQEADFGAAHRAICGVLAEARSAQR